MQTDDKTLFLYPSSSIGSRGGDVSPFQGNAIGRGSSNKIAEFVGSEEAFFGKLIFKAYYLQNVTQKLLRGIKIHIHGGKIIPGKYEMPRYGFPGSFDVVRNPVLSLQEMRRDLVSFLNSDYGSDVFYYFFRKFLQREKPFLPELSGRQYDYTELNFIPSEITSEQVEEYSQVFDSLDDNELLIQIRGNEKDFIKFTNWFYETVFLSAANRQSLFGQILPTLGFYPQNRVPEFDKSGEIKELNTTPISQDFPTSQDFLSPKGYAPVIVQIAANFNPFWNLDRDFSWFYFSWQEKNIDGVWIDKKTPDFNIKINSNFSVLTAMNESMLDSLYQNYPSFFQYYQD